MRRIIVLILGVTLVLSGTVAAVVISLTESADSVIRIKTGGVLTMATPAPHPTLVFPVPAVVPPTPATIDPAGELDPALKKQVEDHLAHLACLQMEKEWVSSGFQRKACQAKLLDIHRVDSQRYPLRVTIYLDAEWTKKGEDPISRKGKVEFGSINLEVQRYASGDYGSSIYYDGAQFSFWDETKFPFR
jgi:hypothetical protein